MECPNIDRSKTVNMSLCPDFNTAFHYLQKVHTWHCSVLYNKGNGAVDNKRMQKKRREGSLNRILYNILAPSLCHQAKDETEAGWRPSALLQRGQPLQGVGGTVSLPPHLFNKRRGGGEAF